MILSESTRALGHPKDTTPTFGDESIFAFSVISGVISEIDKECKDFALHDYPLQKARQ
jgi:hypothetical protein